MEFLSTSRRDDMISTSYLLLTMLNEFNFPNISSECVDPFNAAHSISTKYKVMKKVKEKATLIEMG